MQNTTITPASASFTSQKVIKIALIGLGTVGRGTLEVLAANQHDIWRRAGVKLEIAYVLGRDFAKTQKTVAEALPNAEHQPTVLQSFDEVLNSDADIVVELMGGIDIAQQMIKASLKAKKHVVTANKALLAMHGDAIFQLAEREHVHIGFEAAVAGGIPIIKMLREGLSANQIQSVVGIVNGTCNFILSSMVLHGMSFASALAQAQQLGYAEADPRFDVEGVDAAHKMSILSSLAFGTPIAFDQAYIEGIHHIDVKDIDYAKMLGYTIKLLGITTQKNGSVSLRVHPCFVDQKHMLANVNGVMNAVMVSGDAVGDTLYYGRGAGSKPTASAVIADMIDIARSMHAHGHQGLFSTRGHQVFPFTPMRQTLGRHYIRLQVRDQAGILARITQALAQQNISIESMMQKPPLPINADSHQTYVDVIILTHACEEDAIQNALHHLKSQDHDAHIHAIHHIRILDF